MTEASAAGVPEPGDPRARLIRAVTHRIPRPPAPRCVRVGVDGVDGVGKSTFAAELAASVRRHGRPVVQVSADDFHHRRAVRYARGRDSPEGFWRDSYDVGALHRDVLRPFGPGGSRRYRRAAHDLRTDQPVHTPWLVADAGTVLIVDGLFLHRDELRQAWDFSIFLDAPFEVTVARLARRDGSPADPTHPGVARYVGGQRLYFAACAPWRRADVVIDHTDVTHPRIVGTAEQ